MARIRVEAVEPRERVRLQDASEAFEVLLGMLTRAVPREVEEGCRRVWTNFR
jgi:hypothetical protein